MSIAGFTASEAWLAGKEKLPKQTHNPKTLAGVKQNMFHTVTFVESYRVFILD